MKAEIMPLLLLSGELDWVLSVSCGVPHLQNAQPVRSEEK